MTDVVIGVPDQVVDVRLILTKHCNTVVIGVGIGRAVGINQRGIIGDQNQSHRDFFLIDACHTIDRCDNRRLSSPYGSPVKLGVLPGCCVGQAISAKLGSRPSRSRGVAGFATRRIGSCTIEFLRGLGTIWFGGNFPTLGRRLVGPRFELQLVRSRNQVPFEVADVRSVALMPVRVNIVRTARGEDLGAKTVR